MGRERNVRKVWRGRKGMETKGRAIASGGYLDFIDFKSNEIYFRRQGP